MSSEVTAIIVARKGSVRVKNKALQTINGESLIERKIKQLKLCKNIDRVIVGTDCDEIGLLCEGYGAEVVYRNDYYCDESKATANEMIGNMMSLIETDIVVWAHCTNPLISSDTYDKAIELFNENKDFDSLLSVIEFKEHLWSDEKKPMNYNPYGEKHTLARDLPTYYFQDGGIFIQKYLDMKKNSYFFGKKPQLFVIDNTEFCDINTYEDLERVRYILERKND